MFITSSLTRISMAALIMIGLTGLITTAQSADKTAKQGGVSCIS